MTAHAWLAATGAPGIVPVIAVVVLALAVWLVVVARRRASARQEPEGVADSTVEAGSPETSLRDGLQKTRRDGFVGRIGRLIRSGDVSSEVMEGIEEVLFTADVGVKTAERLLSAAREEIEGATDGQTEAVWARLREEARALLALGVAPPPTVSSGPQVTMVLGVNGSGKTTTIGKLAHRLHAAGETAVLVAGDTFRAAAVEQLEQWGRRVGASVVKGREGADPASVVFDGVRQGIEEGAGHILVDTAGRLHTQKNLMDELEKVHRVIGKAVPGAPHEVLLVLDATMGQNAIQQARMFSEVTGVTALALTKLDGTAKGGVALGVCAEMGLPIRFIGIGERVEDLRPFDADAFVEALFAS